jgi:hypothetical protein
VALEVLDGLKFAGFSEMKLEESYFGIGLLYCSSGI